MKTPPIVPSEARAPEPPDEASQFAPASTETRETSIQILVQPHLGSASLKLFHDLTGHQLHLIWHTPHEFDDPRHLPLLCPLARKNLNIGRAKLPKRCATCQRDNWCPLETPLRQGRLLNGACGGTCFWAALHHDTLRAATLVLHADSPSPGFDQAVQLLRQFLIGTEAALAARPTHRQRDLPTPQQDPSLLPPVIDSHGNAIVRMMLDYLHTHYQRPLGLADVAAALKMNASYLSHLFSTIMGTSFHHHLANLRLEKAKEFLRDPTMRVCEVAAASGFASPNHFNNVFKITLGLTPSAWRKISL
jgi:AraC-like DNA-binding protein